eukprot:gene10102-2522_t
MNEEIKKEINEILNAETFIDLEKLRDLLSSEGIPSKEERNILWKLFLNVLNIDKSVHYEITKSKRLKEEYLNNENINTDKEVSIKIVSDIQKYSRFKNIEKRKKMKRILISYYNYYDIKYDYHFIHLLEPFIESMDEEFESYFSFNSFMNKINFKFENYNLKLGKFLMLFRNTQPQLYSHFQIEELESNQWSKDWIKYYLSFQLKFECLLEIWDMYFILNDFELHIYICLSILQHFTMILLDFNYSEILTFLNNLPKIPTNKIIKQALNIREYVKEKSLL